MKRTYYSSIIFFAACLSTSTIYSSSSTFASSIQHKPIKSELRSPIDVYISESATQLAQTFQTQTTLQLYQSSKFIHNLIESFNSVIPLKNKAQVKKQIHLQVQNLKGDLMNGLDLELANTLKQLKPHQLVRDLTVMKPGNQKKIDLMKRDQHVQQQEQQEQNVQEEAQEPQNSELKLKSSSLSPSSSTSLQEETRNKSETIVQEKVSSSWLSRVGSAVSRFKNGLKETLKFAIEMASKMDRDVVDKAIDMTVVTATDLISRKLEGVGKILIKPIGLVVSEILKASWGMVTGTKRSKKSTSLLLENIKTSNEHEETHDDDDEFSSDEEISDDKNNNSDGEVVDAQGKTLKIVDNAAKLQKTLKKLMARRRLVPLS